MNIHLYVLPEAFYFYVTTVTGRPTLLTGKRMFFPSLRSPEADATGIKSALGLSPSARSAGPSPAFTKYVIRHCILRMSMERYNDYTYYFVDYVE
jgi:hypothetical protein